MRPSNNEAIATLIPFHTLTCTICALLPIGWVGKAKTLKCTRFLVSILRVETPHDAHWICGMRLRGVIWSIQGDSISSFAFWLYLAKSAMQFCSADYLFGAPCVVMWHRHWQWI